MAKRDLNIPSVYDMGKYLKKENQLPVYFLCGTDAFTIENAVKALLESFSELAESEFDKEIITADKNLTAAQIIDAAYAFPFGGGKKILVINAFQNVSDKKQLKTYIENPADSTILIIAYPEKLQTNLKEPFTSLINKGYLFQADQLKGASLKSWVNKQFVRRNIKISADAVSVLVDLVGEDKSLLEMQIIKLADSFDGEEITVESIEQLASRTKEFNIFDLQDAISAGNKQRAYVVIENLIEKGNELTLIIASLGKYLLIVAQSKEISKSIPNDFDAARKLGISKYFYTKCKNARYFNSFTKLNVAVKSLLAADIRIKTSAMSPKQIGGLLIAELFE